MNRQYLVGIDQGTSSSRTVIFDHAFNVLASAQQEFQQHYPQPGWVEHNPEDIWSSVKSVTQEAMTRAKLTHDNITSIGITNQRETTLVWDRDTGVAVYNAIVWQDRRTADTCSKLRDRGVESDVAAKTGLRLDPYFSATKIAWILDNVDGVRERANSGELLFGTVDTFILWRLTGGRVHATDATNASRTLLFNIHDQDWDDELLELFGIPRIMLPQVRDCASDFGATDAKMFGGAVAIGGIAGDQQAALLGQAAIAEGMTKSTYGTGCFVIANTGNRALLSNNQLLTTVASRIDGAVTYGLEGSVFVAGSAIQWLRDALQIIKTAPETEKIANATGVVEDVYVVPAFAGLGAPYWEPHARGAIVGLTRGSGREQISTATLQAVAFQTRDLMNAIADDGITPSVIRVDGGMVANDWFLQFLADVLNVPVERPRNVESTVLGAAYLAALQSGIVASADALTELWQSDQVFEPVMGDAQRGRLLSGWDLAIRKVQVSA